MLHTPPPSPTTDAMDGVQMEFEPRAYPNVQIASNIDLCTSKKRKGGDSTDYVKRLKVEPDSDEDCDTLDLYQLDNSDFPLNLYGFELANFTTDPYAFERAHFTPDPYAFERAHFPSDPYAFERSFFTGYDHGEMQSRWLEGSSEFTHEVTERLPKQVEPAPSDDTNVQYEEIRCSPSGWKENLWKDEWEDEFLVTEQTVRYVLERHPYLAVLPGPPQGDLDNPIEPLIDRQNWLLDDDLVWDRMTPALRMVSKFLTVPQVLSAFAPLINGKARKAWKNTKWSKLDYDDKEMEAGLPGAIDGIREALHALVGNVKFSFAVLSKREGRQCPGQVHGIHYAPREAFKDELYVQYSPRSLETYKDSHKIFLNGAYSEFLKQDLTQIEPIQYSSTLFVLAVTMVHEIAHMLYYHLHEASSQGCSEHVDYDEPFIFEDEGKPEIGCAIERRLFGSVWHAIVHPERGVDVESWTRPRAWIDGELVECDKTHLIGFIEPQWMHAFLTQARWNEISSVPAGEKNGAQWPAYRFFFFRKDLRADKKDVDTWNMMQPRVDGPDGPEGCAEDEIRALWATLQKKDREYLRNHLAAVKAKAKKARLAAVKEQEEIRKQQEKEKLGSARAQRAALRCRT